MKLLYVGDNRSRHNWGCRATSKALQTLILKNNELSGTIHGDEIYGGHTKTIYSSIIPVKWYKRIEAKRKNLFFRILYAIISTQRIKDDYLSEDIDASIEFFEENNKYFPHLLHISNLINSCDAMVINGEGTMIFTISPRRDTLFYLFMLKLAKKRNKKTFYLNAMISDPPNTGRNEQTVLQMLNIFATCDGITLRDPQSHRILTEIDKNKTLKFEFIPDALFTWRKYFADSRVLPPVIGDSIIPWPDEDRYFGKFDFNKPYICISGSSSAAWNQEKARKGYVHLVKKLKETGLQLYLVPTCTGDKFLYPVSEETKIPVIPIDVPIVTGATILANAELFVSGRFHPSILASLGGTPCIFMGSNSHKTYSLQEMLGYSNPIEYNDIPSEQDIDAIYEKALNILKSDKSARQLVKNKVKELAEMSNRIVDIC